jgi:hypothetical protein
MALRQLTAGERSGSFGQQGDRAGIAVLGKQGERSGKEQVTHSKRAVASLGGGDRGAAAAQRRVVENVIVDEGGHVDQLDRSSRTNRLRSTVCAGTKQNQ